MRFAAQARIKSWDRALDDIELVQLETMRDLAKAGIRTEYGKKCGFASINSYADWKRSVPLADYDSFHPYIERMMRGEHDVLAPGFVPYFGNSSGSSNNGRSKFLPITDKQLKYQRQMSSDAAFRYVHATGDADLLSGFTMALLPPTVLNKEGPVIVSNNPALMFAKLPIVAKPNTLPQGRIRLEQDYNKKLRMIAETYLDHDVRAVTGTTCWFSLLFDNLLEAARRKGRSAESVSEMWPNLRVLFGGGVSAAPYLPVIRERMGRDITLVDTYNATEGGLYAVSDHSGEKGMLMIPDRGVFFEFIPVEQIGQADPQRYAIWEVEKDRNYAIVVSTVSGLYAYILGDIVRFPSLSPARMEFAGRLQGCLSTTQELTTHVEVESAVVHTLEKFDYSTVDFCCAADIGVDGTAKSRYVLYVEFDGNFNPADAEAFAQRFDEGLCLANRVYREHRKEDAAILAPRLVVMPSGSVPAFLKAAGITSVQAKFPRILNENRHETMIKVLSGA